MREIEKVRQDSSGSSTVLCFLAGFTTGVAAAMLLAPHAGAGTRNLIGRKFQEGEDWLKSQAASAESRLRARGAEILDRVQEAGEAISRP